VRQDKFIKGKNEKSVVFFWQYLSFSILENLRHSYLMAHVRRVHDGVIANPRPCPKCDYVASCPSELCTHFTARHTTRRFQCAYGCSHGYSTVGSLSRHLKEKHRHKRKRYIMLALHKDDAKPKLPENDTLPHQCELCDWRFPNLNFLAYHIKAKHC
jgi:hypothetical protein